MRKYWGSILAALLTLACEPDKKVVDSISIPAPVEKPVVTHYGFNLENYDVVKDTIRWGDSFGELMLKNHVDYPKIVTISENFRDTFDVRKIKVGKPYLILKSKDSLQKAQVFIYQNDKINYTVVDLRDSVLAYKGKKNVKFLEREVAGVIKNSLSMKSLLTTLFMPEAALLKLPFLNTRGNRSTPSLLWQIQQKTYWTSLTRTVTI